ncbi:MAG TPA: DUF2207 domain-containing protein [Candidatus Acidoferrum sp.]|nr:DUF2207 domain-containing protein [Candidatus Acidoferrum sp.]
MMTRAMFRPRPCALALFLLLFSPVYLLAQGKQLRIQKFDSEISVTPDAKVDVTENITLQFKGGPWHGVYRTIPVEYVGPSGLNYSLFLDVRSVTDGNGNKLRFESSRVGQNRKLKIYIPDADNSTQTVVIDYVVSDALRFFDDYDEFYWNVTGEEWEIPIDAASAHIVLPPGASGIRANVFTGSFRSKGREASAEVAGTGVDVTTTASLGIHEGLTIAVAFDKGAVHEPTAGDKFLLYLRSNWAFFLPIVAFVLMFWLWWTKGRDPRLRPITAQYEPPDKLTPGEVGTLVDNSVVMRDITASIVDLAVRGYLVIEEQQKDHLLGLTHSKEYVFHLKKSQAEWNTLQPHEQALLSGLFSGGNAGDSVSLSELHNRFYTSLPGIKSDIFASLVGRGYYKRRPDSVRSGYLGFGVVMGVILIFGGNAIARNMGMAPTSFIVAGILTGAIICGFGWFMPAHTQIGARALEGVLGFEDFLNHVEADRFNRTIKTPEMFEKFLPFAMALGVEKNWSNAFKDIYTQPPQWYQGSFGPAFYPYMFVGSLNSMSSLAGTAMASAPRSSGGSGFGGGGGFSGGGFGGGGGGGF